MPSLDLNQSILSGEANYQAGDWFSAGASGELAINAAARLKRGIDLELGVGVMGSLDAVFQKFLAADAQVRAQASARLKGQVQVPMDLFGEAGLAVRLQAVAEAGASVRLAIGLSIGDFIALAKADPHMKGIALDLLIIFLEELNIQAGVDGKVAYSAMAYVNLVITGRLLDLNTTTGSLPAGFTIAGEYGVGFEGGYGCQVFANLDFKDVRRLIRRSVDVSVDATLRAIAPLLEDDASRNLLFSLRAPAKVALRAGFELGLSLAEQAPTLLGDSRPELARRTLMVMFEESQRLLLELFIQLAVELFKAALTALGSDPNNWENAEPQRLALASLLRDFPEDAFSLSAENAAYWLNLIQSAANTAISLGGPQSNDAAWVQPLAIIYAATQLLAAGLNRINDGSARFATLGSFKVETQIPPFTGSLQGAQPSDPIGSHLRAQLGLASATNLDQGHLAEYLTQDVLLQLLVDTFPAVQPFLDILAGPQNVGLVAAARVMLTNLGAFIPDANDPSTFDPVESLKVLAAGLNAYMDARVERELQPLLHDALQNQPDLVLYTDDVLIATLKFTTVTVLDQVIHWAGGQVGARDALRDACSSIVMKLLGRSLVVTADVLMDHSLRHMSTALVDFSGHLDDPGGAAQFIANLPSSPFDRSTAAELLEETLLIAAEVFGPLPTETRSRIRDLLYDIVDTMPPNADSGWIEQLKQDFFVPDETKVMALAGELSDSLLDKMNRFFMTVLARVAEIVWEEMAEQVGAIAKETAKYLSELQQTVADLYVRLLALPGEIAGVLAEANNAFEDALAGVERFLTNCTNNTAKTALRNALRDHIYSSALGVLTNLPGYTQLNRKTREAARSALLTSIGKVVDDGPIGTIMNGLQVAASLGASWTKELRDLVADLSELDPNANLSAQVSDALFDRIEPSVREAFGFTGTSLPISFGFEFKFYPPKVYGPTRYENGWPVEWGWTQPPPIVKTFSFDLGTIPVPLSEFVSLFREAFQGLAFVEDTAKEIAEALNDHLFAVLEVEALETEQDLVTDQHAAAEEQLSIARPSPDAVDLVVLSPLPGALYDRTVSVEIALAGVPSALLGQGILEGERLFVWINGTSVSPDEFQVDTASSESALTVSDKISSYHTEANTRPIAAGSIGFTESLGVRLGTQNTLREQASSVSQPQSNYSAPDWTRPDLVAKVPTGQPTVAGIGGTAPRFTTFSRALSRHPGPLKRRLHDQPAPALRALTQSTIGWGTTEYSARPKRVVTNQCEPTPKEIYDMITHDAFFRAECRDFCPGGEIDDWLQAEEEIGRLLENRRRTSTSGEEVEGAESLSTTSLFPIKRSYAGVAELESARRKLEAAGALSRRRTAVNQNQGLVDRADNLSAARPAFHSTGTVPGGPESHQPRVGADLREYERSAVLETLNPSLVVRFNLPLDELRQGINTLHVALIDGENDPLERTVVFIASAGPDEIHSSSSTPDRRPPGTIEWALDDLPEFWHELRNIVSPFRRTASAASQAPKRDGSLLWLPPSAERKKIHETAKQTTTTRLEKTRLALNEARSAVNSGKLRPVPKVRNANGQINPLPHSQRQTRGGV